MYLVHDSNSLSWDRSSCTYDLFMLVIEPARNEASPIPTISIQLYDFLLSQAQSALYLPHKHFPTASNKSTNPSLINSSFSSPKPTKILLPSSGLRAEIVLAICAAKSCPVVCRTEFAAPRRGCGVRCVNGSRSSSSADGRVLPCAGEVGLRGT